MFSWLFDNIPESDERVTLVHGDIGLHNLLYHQGKLSAVLDWEFSHIGDPAEDIGYISIVMGQQLDWESFLDEYCKAGRPRPDRKRIRFFEIWALIRNFSNSNISVDLFARSELENARFAMIPAHYNPYYANRIFQLIRDWDK
jgi:aminoglycoside phosphotransferase (APT) family kinase protein